MIGLTDEKDCMSEVFVRIEWMDRDFGVPLTQLELLDVDSETQEAVADLYYWSGDSGRLC